LRTRFIILSAYNDFEYVKAAMRYGVSDYILKPIDDEELGTALKRVRDQIENEIGTLESETNRLKFAASNYINVIIKNGDSEEPVERCRELLGLSDSDFLRCALVEINHFDKWMNDLGDNEIQNKRLAIRRAIEDAVGSEHMLKIFDDNINRFGIIITREMVRQEEQYFDNLKRAVWESCKSSVSVSLSEEEKGLNDLGKLYNQALFALQYRLFQTDGGVLYYEKFKNIPLDYNFYESNPDALLRDMMSNNLTGINDKIDNIFNEFYEKKCAPEVVANYIKNIEFEMVRHIQEHNGSVDELIARLEEFIATIGKTPVDSLKEEFHRLAIYISDYYKSISSRSSKDIIIAIKEFVNQNYQKDLKLQQVAKDYFVNPVYLGQVFAKTVGMHFNEYLHSVRIEEAKKLLRRTNTKISVIASMVGYNDSDYFVNKFKANTRQLPSDYRKKESL
jgi:Response regulator containing CheY-like receiver domain and AraC-type DNA-binding domain